MPKAVKTGDFTLVVWGTDERHYPCTPLASLSVHDRVPDTTN